MIAILEPSYEFWENDLEIPAHYLFSRFQNSETRKLWIDSLTGKQLNIIFQHCFNHQQQLFDDISHDDMSVQQKRKIIISGSDTLFNYYLVSYFDRTKLESAISEVARLALTHKLMELYLIKNNTKYDKRSLLFLLFHTNYSLLKSVYHFDKVQKRGFIAFILQKAPRQVSNTSFKDFISQYEAIEQILKEDDIKQNDGFTNQLQGFFYHQNRIYVFIRRASDIGFLLNSNKVIHGHKPDWMILDFSLTGTQVNFCAKNISQAERIANSIVSQYFEHECVFINMQEQNFAAQIYKFLQVCIEGADTNICIFEIKFRSTYFRDSSTTYLTLTIKPYSSMALELDVLKLSIGSNVFGDISCVHSIRVMFHNKKVTLFFKSSGEYVTIYYLEHYLNKKEREELKTHMKQFYGLTILSKTNS